MADSGLTYKPLGGKEIDLGRYAPGLRSSIAGRWGRHVIPGQRADLKEDLGDGSLINRLHLEFCGATALDYYAVIPAMTQSRRGTLLTPRRGSRQVVITSVSEDINWVDRGVETTLVDIEIEDEVIGQADAFQEGPSARGQSVVTQSIAADNAAAALRAKVFARPDLAARALVLDAVAKVSASTAAARSYSDAAQEAFSLGFYGPSVQAQLVALPAAVQSAQVSLRLVGPAADVQQTSLAMEAMLFAATQLDIAIRDAQPIPIKTTVRRQPGQGLYAFVQQHYGRSGKSPSDMRSVAGLILRLNPQIRRPLLIPAETVIVRPVS